MRNRWVVAASLAAGVVLAGCGPQVATAKPSHTITSSAPSQLSVAPRSGEVQQPGHPNHVIIGGQPFYGAHNLAHFVQIADANRQSVSAQWNAAKAEFVNGHMKKALAYYQKAVALAPKNGVLLNDEANIYYRGLKEPGKALPLYQEAIKLDPSYAVAWLNIVDCENSLHNATAARSYAQQALKVISPSSKLYSFLKQEAQ